MTWLLIAGGVLALALLAWEFIVWASNQRY